MKWLLAAVAALGCLQCRADDWLTSYTAAYDRSVKEQRPLFISFEMAGCPACVRTHATIQQVSLREFVALRVRYEADPETVSLFGVTAFPTLVIGTFDGDIYWRHTGYIDVQPLGQTLQDARTDSEARKGRLKKLLDGLRNKVKPKPAPAPAPPKPQPDNPPVKPKVIVPDFIGGKHPPSRPCPPHAPPVSPHGPRGPVYPWWLWLPRPAPVYPGPYYPWYNPYYPYWW